MCLAPWQALEDKSEQYKRRAHGQALVTTQALNLINLICMKQKTECSETSNRRGGSDDNLRPEGWLGTGTFFVNLIGRLWGLCMHETPKAGLGG